VELAVEAMRRGARDFIQKTLGHARLAAILKTQIELGRALRKGQRLEEENARWRAERFPQLIAQSAAMRPVLDVISRVGPSDANVLITGENGTGKGLVAQTLHAVSLRSSRPLVTVNTGGLAEGVFESELFGHVKGAFTDAKTIAWGVLRWPRAARCSWTNRQHLAGAAGQAAAHYRNGEFERVGSSKTRRVDVRIFSASNADLQAAVSAGTFRQEFVLPVEHHRAAPAAAAATGARISRRWRVTSLRQHAQRLPQAAHGLRRRGHEGPAGASLAGRMCRELGSRGGAAPP